MPLAFVLINTEVGAIEEVLESLKQITEVMEAYGVYGVYDIIAKIEAESMDTLKEIVTGKIRRINRVMSTLTIIVMKS
jgi:DNA-binding Lrp family transcriptional regulator